MGFLLNAAENEYLREIIEELELSSVDRYTCELPEKLTFQSMVQTFLDGGGDGLDAHLIFDYLMDVFFYEITAVKPLFFRILCLSFLFAIFGRILFTRQKYVSDLSFFVVYTGVMMLLLNSFVLVGDVVETGIEKMVAFLTAFIPTYATTLLLTGNASSAGVFYELAFGLIYLLELAIKNLLIPGIHIFVLFVMMDNLFDEAKLSKISDLIEDGIRVLLKFSLAAVAGLGVVQSLLAPAKDRLASSSVYRALQAVPGVGNTFGAAGEILVGSCIMIKNCVGAAALVILVVLCLAPAISVAAFYVMYRLAGAFLQPFCDRRIGNCVHGVSRACGLYLKIMFDAMLLFFITIAMIGASTSFVY